MTQHEIEHDERRAVEAVGPGLCAMERLHPSAFCQARYKDAAVADATSGSSWRGERHRSCHEERALGVNMTREAR
jgi:hypothetical protein